MSRKPFKIIAGLVAVGLLAAACGSSSTTATTTTVKVTGSPIVVGQIVPMTGANLALPQVGNSLRASIDALNASGGISGHPIQLIQCDSKGDPNTEVQCAQTLVNDHIVATLVNYAISSSKQVNQILAGIPNIGLTMFDPADYANKANFALTGGGLFEVTGMLDSLINKGDKKLSLLLPDVPAAGQFHLLLDPIVQAQGAKVVNYILVSSASGDYSQYVAQAEQNGAQGVSSALGNAQLVQFAQTFDQLNSKLDLGLGVGSLSVDQLKQLVPFTKKPLYTAWTPGIDDTKDFPGIAPAVAQLTKYMKGATIDNLTALSLESWLAVHAFSEVMKSQSGTPTAASIVTAFKAAKDIPMNGIIKPWTPTDYQNAGMFNSIFGNVSNPYMYVIRFNGTGTTTNPSTLFSTFQGLTPTTTTSTSAAK